MNPVICMVAPNGARRGKSDHPQIPLTVDELARTAAAVVKEGATAFHLHVRDAGGHHSLSTDIYCKATEAIRNACGENLLLQVTTEAAGIYSVQQQIALVYDLQPQAVSLSLRELAIAEQKDISKLDRWMRDQQVLPQWIIYSESDLEQYRCWIKDGVLCGSAYPVLFVLGNYSKKIVADVALLDPYLESFEAISSWMVCAFGHTEQEIMKTVIKKRGHMRVGFENNLVRPDKSQVRDNAELVALGIATARDQGRAIATVEQTRELLTPAW